MAILTFSGWEGGRGRENRSALGLGYVQSWFVLQAVESHLSSEGFFSGFFGFFPQ